MIKRKPDLVLLAGTRPNYMKIFPLLKEMQRSSFPARALLIHTGQHYDKAMSHVFFKDFGMPEPDVFLGIGSGSHGRQTGRLMIAIEEQLERLQPKGLVVVGDVNSTLAGALVAAKMGIPVVHVEAGLRSFDRSMPEEINRMATDAVADLLFTSCRDGDDNLRHEGVPESRIRFVGNIMIDSLHEMLPRSEQSNVLQKHHLTDQPYIAVTLHRPFNVDDPRRLGAVLKALNTAARGYPVVFPVHPRTAKTMREMSEFVPDKNMLCIEPLGYLDFIKLMSKASLVLTDSGGIQEETTVLGIPCLTLRPNTERPVTIREGTNRLVDPLQEDVSQAIHRALDNRPEHAPEIEGWDGHTAGRILDVLLEEFRFG